MELYEEIILQYCRQERSVSLQNSMQEIAEKECYKALKEIKAVLEDDCLNNNACFQKIEEIVCIFEQMGSNGGNRHDFG